MRTRIDRSVAAALVLPHYSQPPAPSASASFAGGLIVASVAAIFLWSAMQPDPLRAGPSHALINVEVTP